MQPLSVLAEPAALLQTGHPFTLPTGRLQISTAPGPYTLEALVGIGARANAKRGFSFVSKVLGKNWPVRPSLLQAALADMVARIPSGLPEPVAVVGLAETATGLGQGVFEALLTQRPGIEALYLHSSRHRLPGLQALEFEEAHSHAPRHLLHLPANEALRHRLHQARTLILVDDEASTGNTFLNLARACQTLCPRLEHLHLATLTDFMGPRAELRLALHLGRLRVSRGALLDGEYAFTPGSMLPEAPTAQRFGSATPARASADFGRAGIGKAIDAPEALADRLARTLEPEAPVLVLGTGEFMHLPFRLAQALENRGLDVRLQATTRSPLIPWGAVAHLHAFADNYGEGIRNYLYNVEPGQYAEVLICHETAPGPELRSLAEEVQGRLLWFRAAEEVVC